MTQPTQDPKSDYFGFFDEASQLDPKDLAKITLPKQVKGKIEYHSTPATKPLDELLSNPDKSNTTKSGFEITFDPVHLRAEIQALITNAEKQARNTPTHIMGKTIDEVCGILAMLDMERLAEMQLTMANLHKWYKLLAEEQKAMLEKSITDRIKELDNL